MPAVPPIAIQIGSAAHRAPLVELVLALALLSFAPAIVVMFTSFTRIVIVLSLLRSAIGLPSVPPNLVVTGMALVLTFFTMAPTLREIDTRALEPYLRGQETAEQAVAAAQGPLREFMLRQTRDRDIALFVRLARLPQPRTPADLPTYALVPAFVTSELGTAFTLGTLLFLPFVVIDLAVSSTLLSLGMFMLPPTVISLPIKLLLFVLANGWERVIAGVAAGVR
jgi:flagellar biosynthetic protein FliP